MSFIRRPYRVSCPEVDLSVEPDFVLVTNDSLNSGRVRLVPRAGGGTDRYIELEGPPDLIVEIVSDASVRKDTSACRTCTFAPACASSGSSTPAAPNWSSASINRRAGYEPAPVTADGFQYSAVLNRWYQLLRTRNRHGRIAFELPNTRVGWT